MNEVAVLELGREALWTILKVSGPLMLAGLGVGLIIALFQALTTIQEMTLTFVPKIIVIFVAIIVMLPFMMSSMLQFSSIIFDRMSTVG